MIGEHLNIRVANPIELKASAVDDAGQLSGYLAAFGGDPDSHQDVIHRGAFTKTLKDHAQLGLGLPMLWNHKTDMPIGTWSDLHEDAHGLQAKGNLNLDEPLGMAAYGHIRAGHVSGLSIAFVPPAHGKSVVNGVRHLTELHLIEGSVTANPSNPRARIIEVKSLRDLEGLLHDQGLSKAAARKLAAGGWPALAGAETQDDLSQLVARIEAATQTLRTS